MSEPSEEILIKEELMRYGVADDVATEAKHVFYTVRRYKNPRMSYVVTDRFGPNENSPQKLIAAAANVTDCLRVLEDHDFIRFNNGRYSLTEKGKKVK